MNDIEIELKEKLDEAYNNYLIEGTTKSMGLYNRALNKLNSHLQSINKPLKISDVMEHNKQIDASLVEIIGEVDDTPYLIDDILDGGVIE